MATDVVQRRVVLVRLPIRGVGVQALPELGVPLIELPGQGLVSAHQGLAELGGRVAHDVSLWVGERWRRGGGVGYWLEEQGCGRRQPHTAFFPIFLPPCVTDLLLLLPHCHLLPPSPRQVKGQSSECHG